MAYLSPQYQYDVFVSYSHGGSGAAVESPLKKWTRALIEELRAHIQAVGSEFDNLQIWKDEQIDPTIQLTDELRAKVKSSCIGNRVVSMKVGGKELEETRIYKVATNDYLARGGGGYETFGAAEKLRLGPDVPLMAQVIIDYIRMKKNVHTGVEGRIVFK